MSQLNTRNCQPEFKTLNYLKKNLLYCFDPNLRQQLKERIDRIEDTFFSKEQRGMNKIVNEETKEETLKSEKKWKDAANFKKSVRKSLNESKNSTPIASEDA